MKSRFGNIFPKVFSKTWHGISSAGKKSCAFHGHLPYSSSYWKSATSLLVFLHPNNTKKFLPLDNGVILTVKVYYHSLVAKRKLKFIDTGKEVKNLSILDAIYTLGNSCDVVSSSTVVNCFRKAVVLRKKKNKKNRQQVLKLWMTHLSCL